MNHSGDNSIEFCSGQGACGMALETENVVFSHLFNTENDFNLNKNQKEKQRNLRLSFPYQLESLTTKRTFIKVKL